MDPIPIYGRTRTQNKPDFSGSNVVLGKLHPAIFVGGVPTGRYDLGTTVNTYSYNYHANRLFDKAAITMDTVHAGPPYRTGDAFSCLKYDWCLPYEGIYGPGAYERRDRDYWYVGGFHPPRDFSPLGVIDRFSFDNLPMSLLLKDKDNLNHPSMEGLGSKAWKSTKPKLQKADVSVFTAELRDVPRALKQASKRYDQIWRAMGGTYTSKKEVLKGGIRLMTPKKVADDFLAQQFGWIPFVRDLIKFDNVVQNYHSIIAQAIARNDRWVRRRVTLEASEAVTPIRSTASFNMMPVGMDIYFPSGIPPIYQVEEVKRTNTTAVGKFKYYRPEFDKSVQDKISQWNQAQQFLTVSGARITPTNVYNMIPWSWAIDWFSNVGDWVDRLTDTWVDSIVSEYCFVMKHEMTVRRAIQFAPFISGPKSFTFERTIDSKQRRKASSPYDFNLGWGDLTPTQLAIAAALGIGRFPKIAG